MSDPKNTQQPMLEGLNLLALEVMKNLAILNDRMDAVEERVRELEINQPTDEGYSIEDYGDHNIERL